MAQVTAAQLEQVAHAMFLQIDTDKSGALDKNEVKTFSINMMKQFKPDAEFNEERFEENFIKLDKNADGKVSEQELLNSLILKAKEGGVLTE